MKMINDLKAKVYDLIAAKEHRLREIDEINKIINEVNSEIIKAVEAEKTALVKLAETQKLVEGADGKPD